MATDFRVVTPDDMGNTIRLGAKEPNKYDVDVSQLDLPAGVTGLTLQGTVLSVQTSDGDKTVDLAPMLPQNRRRRIFEKRRTYKVIKLYLRSVLKMIPAKTSIFNIGIADLAPGHN